MSEQHQDKDNLERPHIADGIKEYDNPLPAWWVWLFIGCIIFGIIYQAYYHAGGGTSLQDELRNNMTFKAKASRTGAEAGGLPPEPSEDGMIKGLQDKAVIAAGKDHFSSYCAACHQADMGGLIGPNLVDGFWLHGCRPNEVYRVIDKGVPEKGMAAWGPILGQQKIIEVMAYIYSMQGSQPLKPKEKQGKPCTWNPGGS